MYKKVVKGNQIKYKFLGIPIKILKWNNNSIKIKFLGIPIWKIKRSKNKFKVYFCGLRIFSVKDMLSYVVPLIKYDPASNLKIKALEILNERRNINCEVETSHA